MRKNPIIKKVRWLPFGRGVTLYPYIIVEGRNNTATFKHECMHWYQIQRMGVRKFYWEILKEYLTKGRYAGSLEQEAYLYRYDPLTPEEQEWWDNG